MLGKLLKYDFKWIYKVVIAFNILSIVMAIISRLSSLVNNSTLFAFISSFTCGLSIGFILGALINLVMRSWGRFINNIYKDESYLTHTLPVSKNDIYFSKIFMTIIAILITMVVAVICLFICFYSKEFIITIKSYLESIASNFNISIFIFLFIILLILFLEIIFVVIVGYVGIILGHRFNNNRIGYSVGFGMLMYFGTQIFSLIILFIYGLFNKDVMNIIKTTGVIDMAIVKQAFIFGIVIYLIYNIFYIILGSKLLKKGVNVE